MVHHSTSFGTAVLVSQYSNDKNVSEGRESFSWWSGGASPHMAPPLPANGRLPGSTASTENAQVHLTPPPPLRFLATGLEFNM